jgi:ankyrin repeat protein
MRVGLPADPRPRSARFRAAHRSSTLRIRHGRNRRRLRSTPTGLVPLKQATFRQNRNQRDFSLESGADLAARDEHLSSTPLGWAARYGQRAMVELLPGRGAPKRLPDDPPWATPLAWATRHRHEQIAKLLADEI